VHAVQGFGHCFRLCRLRSLDRLHEHVQSYGILDRFSRIANPVFPCPAFGSRSTRSAEPARTWRFADWSSAAPAIPDPRPLILF
jgi:hypothetical protein